MKCEICKDEESSCDFESRCGHVFHKKCLNNDEVDEIKGPTCPSCGIFLSGSNRVEALIKNGDFEHLILEKEDVNPLIRVAIADKSLPYKIIFEKCLKMGWEINEEINYKNGWCAIHLIACSGRLDLIDHVLSLGAEIDVEMVRKGTSLHLATEIGDLAMVKALVSKGAHIYAEDAWYQTPLLLAVMESNFEMIKFLIENGANVNYEGCRILHYAIAYNAGFDIIDYLLKCGTKHNMDSCFLESCELADISHVQYFIKKGADINAKWAHSNITALHLASRCGRIKTVKYLVEQGLDIEAIDKEGLTPLFMAAEAGQFEIVKFLVSKGASLNVCSSAMGWTMFQVACINRYFEIAEFLLDSGADCKVKTRWQQSMYHELFECPKLLKEVLESLPDKDIPILHAICELDDYELLLENIEKGFDVNLLNFDGETPLFYAISPKIINELLNRSVDVNIRSSAGMTPFLIACRTENICLYEKLLEINTLELEAVCNRNKNALHYAVEKGNLDLIKILIQKGLNVNQIDSEGKSPVNYLIDSYISNYYKRKENENWDEKYLEMIAVLKEAGTVFTPVTFDYFYKNNPVVGAYNALCNQ